MNIRYKPVETISEFIDHIRLRIEVFAREQGFDPKWEPDENDGVSRHYIGRLDDGKVVCAARYRETAPGEIRIERVVTHKDYRMKGIGKGMLEYLIRQIEKQKPKKIWLRGEVTAQEFYEKCGFRAVSEPVNEWGVPIVDMEYKK